MEGINEDGEKESSKCPQPCKECMPVCRGFKKLYMRDSELIECLRDEDYMNRKEEDKEVRNLNKKEKGSKAKDDVIHKNRSTDIKKTSATVKEISDQPKLKCFHCDTILEQVNGLLDEIKTIKQSEAQGLCQHCKLTCFSSKCKRCYYLINKYLSDKMIQHKIRQQEYKMWLSKVKQVLRSILQAETVCRHKERILDTASNQELENLLKELKKPLFSRDLEIGRFPISEFKDTFDISDSLTESKDILEMVLEKLKAEGVKLKREKAEGVLPKSSSQSLSTASIPSLRTKFERLRAKYAMYQKSLDSDFAFASDRLEQEFTSKIAMGLKQTLTTKKILQFGTPSKQAPADKEPPTKYTKVESIMKKRGVISLEQGKGDNEKQILDAEKKKPDERDLSNEDLLTDNDFKAVQLARTIKMIKEKRMKERETESKTRDKNIKIAEIRGTTSSKIKVSKETEKENVHEGKGSSISIENISDSWENAAVKEKFELAKQKISSGSEKEMIGKETEKETQSGKESKAGKETQTEKSLLDKGKLDKLGKKEKGEKYTSAKKGKKKERADDEVERKRKKKIKGKREQDEVSEDEDEVLDGEQKTKKGKGSSDIIETIDVKVQQKKLKPTESAILLLKLLKEKKRERDMKELKKDNLNLMETKAREKYEKKMDKLRKKVEKASNKIPDINKLGKILHKHRRHIGRVRSDFLMQPAVEEDLKSEECNDASEIKEMIKADQVVPFDSHYKDQPPDPENTLFFKVKHELPVLSPLKKPEPLVPTLSPLKVSTVTVSGKKPKNDVDVKPLSDDVNFDINAKGIFRYALSKLEYIDNGYTKLPSIKVMRRMNIYKMVPTNPQNNWFERHKLKKLLFYDTDEKLAEIDEDCHGKWYYRNGILALDYYKAEDELAGHRYVIYSSRENDALGNPRFITVLASFDQIGNGVVYDHNGNLRLKYNQSEGIIVDEKIAPPGRWKWHSLNDPPVLQPIYMDTYMNVKERGQSYHQHHKELLRTENTEETPQNEEKIQAAEEMLAVEFDMFVKKREDKLKLSYKPFQIRMKAFKINEQFSLHIVDQSKVYLIFRDGLVSMKLNLGMKLISKEIVDTEVAGVADVHTPFDRLLHKSASVENIKQIIDETKKSYIHNRSKVGKSASKASSM